MEGHTISAGLTHQTVSHQFQRRIRRQHQLRRSRVSRSIFCSTHRNDPSRTTTSRRGPCRTNPLTHTVQQSRTPSRQSAGTLGDQAILTSVESLDLPLAVDEPHNTSEKGCCDDQLNPAWLPRSECKMHPAVSPRRATALLSAATARLAFIRSPIE